MVPCYGGSKPSQRWKSWRKDVQPAVHALGYAGPGADREAPGGDSQLLAGDLCDLQTSKSESSPVKRSDSAYVIGYEV